MEILSTALIGEFVQDIKIKIFLPKGYENIEVIQKPIFKFDLDLKSVTENVENVYLIKCVGSNFYKIGYTSNPTRRLKQLQTGCPFKMEMAACCPGGADIEKFFHHKFSKFREINEFFVFDDEKIKDVIKTFINKKLENLSSVNNVVDKNNATSTSSTTDIQNLDLVIYKNNITTTNDSISEIKNLEIVVDKKSMTATTGSIANTKNLEPHRTTNNNYEIKNVNFTRSSVNNNLAPLNFVRFRLNNNFTSLSCSEYNSGAIDNEKNLWYCNYGYNTLVINKKGNLYYSQYEGDSVRGSDKGNFIKVNTGTKFISVSCGAYMSAIAIDIDGNLWSKGSNSNGRLGIGHYNGVDQFTKVTSNKKFIAVSLGWTNAMAIDSKGYLWFCGDDSYVGSGYMHKTCVNIPTRVTKTIKFTAVSCGYRHVAAIDNTGNLWVGGDNSSRQLGFDSKVRNICTLTKIEFFVEQSIRIVDVCCGENYTVVLDEDKNLWSCGDNREGQLGRGTKARDGLFFRRVKSDKKFISINCRRYHMDAIDVDGNLWSCGERVIGSSHRLSSNILEITGFNIENDV